MTSIPYNTNYRNKLLVHICYLSKQSTLLVIEMGSQYDQIWSNLATLTNFKILISIWQFFEPTSTNFLCYGANFNCCNGENLDIGRNTGRTSMLKYLYTLGDVFGVHRMYPRPHRPRAGGPTWA